MGAAQLARIRAVVTTGLVVVVAGLVPVALSAYGLSDRALWLVSGLVYLALDWAVIVLALRRPENRRLAGAQARTTPVVTALFWLLEVAIQLPLVLVVLGVRPDLDPALYLTALVVHLFEAAFVLAELVYGPSGPSASEIADG